MKRYTTYCLTVFSGLLAVQLCFAQGQPVTVGTLTKGDINKALHAGEITGNCTMRDFAGSSAASLNPNTIIIRGISQKDGKATIYFMGRVKRDVRADEMPVRCEANLQQLPNGEWVDAATGSVLKR